jgi:hypothetical protein
MGKTVTAILIVAAAIAVNFIPGVGQAISAELVSLGLGISVATAASITAALASTLIGMAITSVTSLLMAGPKLDPPETARSPLKTSIPPRVSAYGQSRLYGAYVLFENTTYSAPDSDAFAPYAIDVYAVHDGPIDAVVQRYLGDDKITITGNTVNTLPHNEYFDSKVHWYETLGQTPGTSFAAITGLLGSTVWSADHRGDGVVTIGVTWAPVKSELFGERFPEGTAAASIAARWQKVFDWRDVTQHVDDPTTWKWSDNACLHLAHYRLVREKARRTAGSVFPTGAALTDAWNLFFAPTIDYWTEAADVCDEAVALLAGGTEKRYRSCFSHKHTDAHKDVLNAMTACFDGWTSPRADGALIVYAGKYYEPTVSIGPDEIVSYSWQHGIVDEEAINQLDITYISQDHDYNVVDADPWKDSDDILARGALRTQGMDFAVPSHAQARRLAKRLMSRVMGNNRGIVTTNVAGRAVRGQRYINLRIAEAGAVFFDGVAEITGLTRNVATGGVTFSWVEASANIDAWNPATEEGLPAPVGDRTILIAPTAPAIDSAFMVFDTTGARIQAELSGPSGTDLVWYARWRRVGDPVWNEQQYNDVDSSAGVTLLTNPVPTSATLEVEVAYKPGTGTLSGWSTAVAVNTELDTVAPDDAVSIDLVSWTDTLVMRTAEIPRAGTYRWRIYQPDGATLIATYHTALPVLNYTRAQAHSDGVRRDYKIDVAGENSAGVGAAIMSAEVDKPAPAAPTAVAFADGAYTSTVTFTAPADPTGVAGYLVAYSTVTGFDPMAQGSSFNAGASPAYTGNLAAGTYYGKVASYDVWTAQPNLLNFSAQDAFAISTGSGGASGGDGGGGYFGGGGGVGSHNY